MTYFAKTKIWDGTDDATGQTSCEFELLLIED